MTTTPIAAFGESLGESLGDSAKTLIQQVEQLLDTGLMLQAQVLMPQLAELPSVEARLLEERLLHHLGAARRSQALVLRLWRQQPQHAAVRNSYVQYLLRRRGPFAAWSFLQKFPFAFEASAEDLAEWYGNCAEIYGMLRDFATAESYYQKARQLAPDSVWLTTQWTYVCEKRDQYAQGVELLREVLAQRPNYRPAVQFLAHLLTLVGADDEALALLQTRLDQSESAALGGQLFELQFERGLYREASVTLDTCERYAPLQEKNSQIWLASRRTDLALRLGNLDAAKGFARQVGLPFYDQIAERLQQDGAIGKRVLLPVGFVRQNYQTCVPATLAALSLYWQRAADHLEIADEICYDGTSNYNERKWAQEQDFIAQEFTVNWQVASALLDAGVPFTLTTTYTASGHLQAVIGYDELRGTLLIRDPFERTHNEFDADKLCELQRSTGPRGMLLLPREQAHRLAGIELPETTLWDAYFAVNAALEVHDRQRAAEICVEMRAKAPQHRMSLQAERVLAQYDGDEPAILANTDALLALYPQDSNLKLSKASSLGVLSTREQQLNLLQEINLAAQPEPFALCFYASLLNTDQRQAGLVRKLVQRALCYAPSIANGWLEWGNLLWRQNSKQMALECYRFASCLQETTESYANTYFEAALALNQHEAALQYLQDRYARLGDKSAQPLISLFIQLEALERTEEGFSLLREELAKQPNPPELVMFAADAFLRYGKNTAAKLLLERTNQPAKQAAWLYAKAKLERANEQMQAALDLALQVVQLEPLNLFYQRFVASLKNQVEGRDSAVTYLRQVCERFNHHCGLHELLVSQMDEDVPHEVEPVLRHLLSINPNNLWAQRELAGNLARQRRYDEARQIMAMVLQMAPNHHVNHAVMASIYYREGDFPNCLVSCRQTLQRDIDNSYALNLLISLQHTLEDRRAALEFVRAELLRQISLGDGLLAFQSAARNTLTPEELCDFFQDALKHRPELWQAWAALGMQYIVMADVAKALAVLNEALQKFPLCPRLYVELAKAQALNNQRPLALETLRTALRISPHWTYAVRVYVDFAYDEGVDHEQILKVIQSALAREPNDASLHSMCAGTLSNLQRLPEAMQSIKKAILLDASEEWHWTLLRRIARASEDEDVVEATARELVASRPGERWSWIGLANAVKDIEQALEAVEKAIALDPHSVLAFETKLELLLRNRRYSELEQALAQPKLLGTLPSSVQMYSARLLLARENLPEAAKKMRSLLDEDPNNFAIWREYAECCNQAKDFEQYQHAAENMLRLAANNYVAHGYMADVFMKQNQQEKAQPHFERAFELDPSYTFASYTLFDQALERKDSAKAQELIDIIKRHCDDLFLHARIVQLAALVHDLQMALPSMKKVVATPSQYSWPTQAVFESCTSVGWQNELRLEVEQVLRDGNCEEHVLWHLIEMQRRAPGERLYPKLQESLAADKQHCLKRVMLDWAGDQKQPQLISSLLADFPAELAQDSACWAKVGFAYAANEQFEKAAEWMALWRQRSDVPVWALSNLNLSLRHMRRYREASEVIQECLRLEPEDGGNKVWQLVDMMLFDQMRQAPTLMRELEQLSFGPFFKVILEVLQQYQRAHEQQDPTIAFENFAAIMRGNPQNRLAKHLMIDLADKLRRASPWHMRLWYRFTYPSTI